MLDRPFAAVAFDGEVALGPLGAGERCARGVGHCGVLLQALCRCAWDHMRIVEPAGPAACDTEIGGGVRAVDEWVEANDVPRAGDDRKPAEIWAKRTTLPPRVPYGARNVIAPPRRRAPDAASRLTRPLAAAVARELDQARVAREWEEIRTLRDHRRRARGCS